MKPVEDLLKEHEALLSMIEIMKKLTEKMAGGEKIDPGVLEKITGFLQVFADKCHHSKEEFYLFPLLSEMVTPADQGIIKILIQEHTFAREYVKGLVSGIAAYKTGDESGIPVIIDNMQKYTSLLGQHAIKENRDIFPLVDMALDKDKQDEIVKNFEKIENEVIGAGKHEAYHKLLDELKTAYLL